MTRVRGALTMVLEDPDDPTLVEGSVPAVMTVFDCSGVVEAPSEAEVENRIRAVDVVKVIPLLSVALMTEATVDNG